MEVNRSISSPDKAVSINWRVIWGMMSSNTVLPMRAIPSRATRGYWGRRMFWRIPNLPDQYFSPHQGDFPTLSKEEEKIRLEDMVKNLEEEIKNINRRIKELSEEK